MLMVLLLFSLSYLIINVNSYLCVLTICTTTITTTSTTESDDSPGVYLRDDFLGGPTELRAPTAERAALFLDAALAGRSQGGLEPAMIFTLHVYQYSLSRKGGGK